MAPLTIHLACIFLPCMPIYSRVQYICKASGRLAICAEPFCNVLPIIASALFPCQGISLSGITIDNHVSLQRFNKFMNMLNPKKYCQCHVGRFMRFPRQIKQNQPWKPTVSWFLSCQWKCWYSGHIGQAGRYSESTCMASVNPASW